MTLKEARIARTLSQAGLARILGVSQATYSLWERGRTAVPVHQQMRLAAVLGDGLFRKSGHARAAR